jgi:hypothetical protein
LKTHELKTKIGVFEVDEFRDFYLVKKKLQHPSQKGFYDPKALVIAKKDDVLPFFPDKDWVKMFGHHAPFFFYHTGIKGKDSFLESMRSIEGEPDFGEILTVPLATAEVGKAFTFLKRKKKK